MYDWLRFPAAGVCTWRGRTFGRWTRHADWVCNPVWAVLDSGIGCRGRKVVLRDRRIYGKRSVECASIYLHICRWTGSWKAGGYTGETKKKQIKFFPDAYKNRIGKSYNDYIADHQMNMFEDFIGYQGSTVLDEPEREAGTTSIPIPQREESENIPLPDLPGQLENVQQSGNEIAERGMPT